MASIISRMLVIVMAIGLGTASAAADQTIELKIPIDLKKLMPEVDHINVVCRILEDEPGEDFMANFTDRLGYGSDSVPVVGGSVQETLTMEIIPEPPHNFSSARFYACHMVFLGPHTPGPPYAGPPTGTPADWRIADPSEPFASQIHGPLSPDIVQILQGPQTLSGGN